MGSVLINKINERSLKKKLNKIDEIDKTKSIKKN